MRNILGIILLILTCPFARAQDSRSSIDGTVSFITQQHVYVKFSSTSGIQPGDTLFGYRNQVKAPLLKVVNLSTTSCVCDFLTDYKPVAGEKFTAFVVTDNKRTTVSDTAKIVPAEPVPLVKDSAGAAQKGDPSKQLIRGFATVASYSTFTGQPGGNSQREKITLSFLGKHLNNTPFSAEVYLSGLLNDHLNVEKQGISNYVKVYNLNISADFKAFTVLLGRKINPRLSSMGANDGLQAEYHLKPFSIGVIAGFRPDYMNYGFNASLFQFGGYLYNEQALKKGMMQNTLAFINQTNSGKTDRRYIYLQHMNTAVKNLIFFGTAELDLYSMKFSNADSTYSPYTTFKLSNLYLSLGYRLFNRLSLSLSYNNRENTVYYETYKNYLDRLLDFDTYQGVLFSATYTPANRVSIGVNSSYRYRQKDPRPGKNLYGFVTYSVPGIETSATASVAVLSTGYLTGNIYSFGLSKDLAKGKVYLGLNYRYVDYKYSNKEFGSLVQNIGEASLTWKIISKLSLSCYYEGTFESHEKYHRVYLQATMGF